MGGRENIDCEFSYVNKSSNLHDRGHWWIPLSQRQIMAPLDQHLWDTKVCIRTEDLKCQILSVTGQSLLFKFKRLDSNQHGVRQIDNQNFYCHFFHWLHEAIRSKLHLLFYWYLFLKLLFSIKEINKTNCSYEKHVLWLEIDWNPEGKVHSSCYSSREGNEFHCNGFILINCNFKLSSTNEHKTYLV